MEGDGGTPGMGCVRVRSVMLFWFSVFEVPYIVLPAVLNVDNLIKLLATFWVDKRRSNVIGDQLRLPLPPLVKTSPTFPGYSPTAILVELMFNLFPVMVS